MKKLCTPVALLALSISVFSQDISEFIHVDQFGYLPNAQKIAVLSDPQIGYNSGLSYTPPATLELRDASNNTAVFSAAPTPWDGGNTHAQSGDRGWWFDFSSVTAIGNYYVYDATNDQRSAVFTIADESYTGVMRAAGRMFFYNRCNAPKEEPYAQGWEDGDNFNNPMQDANCRYIYDPGNVSLEKDLSGGWFDAGDYNKYVTFANSAVHNLLWAYEENPDAFGDNWNIPESGNNIPDLIDELKWELDWLMKMTNLDGSVHIKMGSQNYAENSSSPPSANTDQRFYGPTCSSASIAIAGMFSHAAGIFSQFSQFQSYAAELEQKAIAAYNYSLPFINTNTLETNCDDGSIVAGDADWDADRQKANFMVAAVFLYDLTGDASYNNYITGNVIYLEQLLTNFWGPYFMEANDALIHYTTLPNATAGTVSLIEDSWSDSVINNNNDFFGFSGTDLYHANMPDWSYHWGSNNPKANYGSLNKLALKTGVFPSGDTNFENYIDATIHYFHGVNPQGIVYLSNMYEAGAERSVNEIYHSWFADGTDYDNALTSPIGPAPGFISGGANSQFSVTTLIPPSGQPEQKSYLDFNDGFPNNSWEISEPAIYYQAAYIRLLANRTDAGAILSSADAEVDNFMIYPNPSNETFSIAGFKGKAQLEIYTIMGSWVQTLTVENRDRVDISSLFSGVYLLRLATQDGQVRSQKLIVL
ncbi:MAG: glycoside hydrolase family 9 protein [Bacteroidota bacterium]